MALATTEHLESYDAWRKKIYPNFSGTTEEFIKWLLYPYPARGDHEIVFVPTSDSDAWPGGYAKASIDKYDSNLDLWTIHLRWMKHERTKHVLEKWDAMEEWYDLILSQDVKTKELREFFCERKRVCYTHS